MFRAPTTPLRLLHWALAASTLSMSFPAVAATSPHASAPVASIAAVDAPASVLGLEGGDAKTSEELTAALRRAFERRGYAGGEEITLAELRLTMGCDGNDKGCLAQGGEALQVRRLVYGSLSSTGGGDYSLELTILSVPDALVEKQTTTPVKASELQPDTIDATATTIVNAMFPEDNDDGELPGGPSTVVAPPGGEDDVTDEPAKPRRKSGLVWGRYSPRPKWKWAAFGVSAGLMGVSAIALAVTGIPVVRSNQGKGFLYENLEEKARASLEDDDPINDVDPDSVLDICSDQPGSFGALEQLDSGVASPGVRNAVVGQECKNGETWAKVATGSAIAFGAFTLTTVVFTTLLFVHRESPAADAMMRHKVQVGASPGPDGRGLSFGGGFSF